MSKTNCKIEAIKLDDIDTPDMLNGRFEVSTERVEELAHSITVTGLLHPITLRPNGGRFTLVAGNHRLLAYRRLGYTTIMAKVSEYTDNEAAIAKLSENAMRTVVTPVEEAKQLHDLVEADPEGVDGVAMKIGRSVDWILNRLEIMSWPHILIEYVHSKKVSMAAAKKLAMIEPDALRTQYIHDAASNGINARTASLWLQQSRSMTPTEFFVSDKITENHNPVYESTTKVNCFSCKEIVKLEHTHSVRICHTCIQSIEATTQKLDSPVRPIEEGIIPFDAE